jgi:superfamily I DNA/RNA helicase
VYEGYIRQDGSASNYDIFFYADDMQQTDMLAKWLVDFRDQGYRPSEITVLSFRGPEHCAAAKLEGRGIKVRPARAAGEATGYTSVHAFKGLENKIILLTDVMIGEADFQRYLFYVGMTRATETVRVLCDSRCRDRLMSWVLGGIET